MNCLGWLQLKDSSNKVAIVVIVIVLAMLIFVGYFSYNKAVNTFLGASRARGEAAAQEKISGENEIGNGNNQPLVRKVAPGVYEMNQSSKARTATDDEESKKMVFSVA